MLDAVFIIGTDIIDIIDHSVLYWCSKRILLQKLSYFRLCFVRKTNEGGKEKRELE